MREFIVATAQALQNGQADLPQLVRALEQLSETLEAVENQYASGPEEEEGLRQALLRSLRLYQLSLDILHQCCLANPNLEQLERAVASADEAENGLDEVEYWAVSEDFQP
ncbi:MAG: hypothetical protein U0931_33365 [Vulcanimicrobiota bacterium]